MALPMTISASIDSSYDPFSTRPRHLHFPMLVIAMLCALTACSDPPRPLPPTSSSAIDGPDGLAGMPASLTSEDTSPGWATAETKLLLTGIIYQSDAKTPASNIVLYYYHTNADGRYIHNPAEPRSMMPNELGQTHGSLRGWLRTGSDGRYSIRTFRPGVYPTLDEPSHIHVTIKEPDRPEYYIDEFVFDDDPLLTTRKRLTLENRCGSGILRLVRKDGLLIGERNIILGQNIPGHPGAAGAGAPSGRNIGEDVISFTPFHAWGPDKGTSTCPVCKYGWYHGILYFVSATPDWEEVRSWLRFLEAETDRRAGRLHVYFVYANPTGYTKAARDQELERLGMDLGLRRIALTYLPSLTDTESDIALNNISPDAGNTFLLYRRSTIIDKAIDLKPTNANFQWLTQRLDQTTNEYFDLPK